MHKIITLLFCLCLIVGCAKSNNAASDTNTKYIGYVEAIINNNSTVSSEIPFDYDLSVTKDSKGQYVYEVTISNPKQAMYNVEMMVIDVSKVGSENIFPSIGVIDEEQFNLIPFQSNAQRGFYAALACNGVSDVPQFTLNVFVVYRDYSGLNETRIFFNLDAEYAADVAAPAEGKVLNEVGTDETPANDENNDENGEGDDTEDYSEDDYYEDGYYNEYGEWVEGESY